jgi:hypothetical protein
MNLIEAIKSGRRFRRKSQPNQGYWYQKGTGATFYEDDILADDWKVEQLPVTITKEEFLKAWDKAVANNGGADAVYNGFISLRHLVAKELGL